MALSNKNIGEDQGKVPGSPSRDGYSDTQEQPSSGREYGKEFLTWAGRWLKNAGERLYAQIVKLATRIPQRNFNGVDTKELDKRMRKINWNKDYYSEDAIAKGLRSARQQRNIMRVNSIFRDLKKLSDSGHHQAEELRWKLQRKYWANTRMHPQTSNTLETIVVPANYLTPAKRSAVGYSQGKESRMDRKPIMGNTVDASQRQQQNEARRAKIASASARLTTSENQYQPRQKKGLGL